MNEGIYDGLNEQLDNFNTDKEEIKKVLDGASVIDYNESSYKTLKPLDLFDDQVEACDKKEDPLEEAIDDDSTEVKERQLLEFSFGKNGKGITDELLKIGSRIKTLSEKNYVYLVGSQVDSLDDVYDLIFEIHERD